MYVQLVLKVSDQTVKYSVTVTSSIKNLASDANNHVDAFL